MMFMRNKVRRDQSMYNGEPRTLWRRNAAVVCALAAGLFSWVALTGLLERVLSVAVIHATTSRSGVHYLLTAPAFICVVFYCYWHVANRMACRSCGGMFSNHKCGEKTYCTFHEWRVVGGRIRTLRLFKTRERWQGYRCESCGHQFVSRKSHVNECGVSMSLEPDLGSVPALWGQSVSQQLGGTANPANNSLHKVLDPILKPPAAKRAEA